MKLLCVRMGNITDLGWQFPDVHLKNVNLLVGESASGKSTLLNMIFSIAFKIVQDVGTPWGFYHFRFEHGGAEYEWEMEARPKEDDSIEIFRESLKKLANNSEPTLLFERHETEIKVRNSLVPRMSPQSSCIYLFREDPDIMLVHSGFKLVMRRDFASSELNKACGIQSIPKTLLSKVEKSKSLSDLMHLELTLSNRLFLLKTIFDKQYKKLLSLYKDIFPFVSEFEFKDMEETGAVLGLPGRMPILHVKDKSSSASVSLQLLSSGMKKVLLILTDIVMMDKGTVYLLDEYENSLGVNAINFLPSIIAEYGEGQQFIITSHHPYLINTIPVNNWIVFHRNGLQISVKHGDDLAKSYGKSKQQAFIKLLNDPFFTDGK